MAEDPKPARPVKRAAQDVQPSARPARSSPAGTREPKTAPVARLGLEWAHRLLTNPRRLWRRYLMEGPAIFLLAYRWRKNAA